MAVEGQAAEPDTVWTWGWHGGPGSAIRHVGGDPDTLLTISEFLIS